MAGRFRSLTSLLTLVALALSVGQSARAASCRIDVAPELAAAAAAHVHGEHTPAERQDIPEQNCPSGHSSMAACSAAVSLPAAVALTPAPGETGSEPALTTDDHVRVVLSVDLFHPPRS